MKRSVFTLFFLFFSLASLTAFAITPEYDTSECTKKEVSMEFSFDEQKNTIKISFAEKEVKENDPKQWAYFKLHTSYPFEEEFPLPEDLWKSLGAKNPLVIKTGVYPLTFYQGIYQITIAL